MSVDIEYLYVILLSILPFFSHAQAWIARYDGPSNRDEVVRAIIVDDAGNVYVTGGSSGLDLTADYATVKYNTSGVEQWVARYDGPNNYADVARAIAIDNNGYIYVSGTSSGLGTDFDYATIKYDSQGQELWVVRYNGPSNDVDEAVAMSIDNANNVLVCGYSYGSGSDADYATVKYDSTGAEQWVARYNGPGNSEDKATAISIDNSGNVYITGHSYGLDSDFDYATVKYNSSGIEQWVARYNGPANIWDKATAIIIDNSGNVYITGHSVGAGTDDDYVTIKYDSAGVEQWVARYNGPGNFDDVAKSIALDNTDHIYVTGMSCGLGTGGDYATIKYDSHGQELWVARYDALGNSWDDARAIVVDNACNVCVTGHTLGITEADYATVKYDSLGTEQWAILYNGPGNYYDYGRDIAVDNVGNVYVTGDSYGSSYDYATIKYLSTCVEELQIMELKDNPFHATVLSGPLLLPENRNCKVMDITGRIVMPDKIKTGIYFIEIDGVVTQKVIKIR
jgi:hypothetical protein